MKSQPDYFEVVLMLIFVIAVVDIELGVLTTMFYSFSLFVLPPTQTLDWNDALTATPGMLSDWLVLEAPSLIVSKVKGKMSVKVKTEVKIKEITRREKRSEKLG